MSTLLTMIRQRTTSVSTSLQSERPTVCPRGRPVTRAHMTASMRDTDVTSPHVAPHGHNPNPVVALRRVDTTVDVSDL